MNRERILREYTVENGIIRSPGKFEGERVYVPYFWDLYLNGMFDEDKGREVVFVVVSEDLLMFPELIEDGYGPLAKLRLYQRDDGFVCLLKHCWKDNLLEVQPEDEDPIEYTHYDCWLNYEGKDGQMVKVREWDCRENVLFVKALFDGWADEYNLPNLRDLADKYLSTGQVETMSLVAEEFAKAGYRVYDGEEFLEVYAKP